MRAWSDVRSNDAAAASCCSARHGIDAPAAVRAALGRSPLGGPPKRRIHTSTTSYQLHPPGPCANSKGVAQMAPACHSRPLIESHGMRPPAPCRPASLERYSPQNGVLLSQYGADHLSIQHLHGEKCHHLTLPPHFSALIPSSHMRRRPVD
jgi:hypothetical protein